MQSSALVFHLIEYGSGSFVLPEGDSAHSLAASEGPALGHQFCSSSEHQSTTEAKLRK